MGGKDDEEEGQGQEEGQEEGEGEEDRRRRQRRRHVWGGMEVRLLEDADHFFWGRVGEVAGEVVAFINKVERARRRKQEGPS
jgi:alpha/beta superfamily hydrolase